MCVSTAFCLFACDACCATRKSCCAHICGFCCYMLCAASVVVMGVYEEQIPYEVRSVYLYFMLMTLACAAALACVYACSCYKRYREDLLANQRETSVLDNDDPDFPVIPLEEADW